MICTPDPINPFAHLRAAATGDIVAQRALADEAVRRAVHTDCDPSFTLAEGRVFARLAAAHGGRADKGRLVSMLALAGTYCLDDSNSELAAEALGLLSMMADEGDEEAEQGLVAVADHASPEAMAMAQTYRELMGAK